MRFTALKIQMIQPVLNSCIMLLTKNLLKFVILLVDVSKIKMLKNIVSTIMIQSSARPLEISAIQEVL
jgi:hypothetical protein